MTVQNSVRSYLGIAWETTKGTAELPTDFIPVLASSLKPVDVIDPLYDMGLRGSVVNSYNYIQGRTRSTIDFGGDVFADTIGYPLVGVLGVDIVSGGSAPYTHNILLNNQTAVGADAQPVSYTFTDFYAANVRSYAGVQIHDFTLNFSADGLLAYTAKGTGWASEEAATPTPSFSTVLPTPVWTGTVNIGESVISNTTTGSITMARPVTPIYGISDTQNPYQVFLGALTTTGSFTFVMENDDELIRYLTNTQPAIILNWSQGAGADLTQVQASMSKGAYVLTNIDRSADFVTITCDVNAQANFADSDVGYSSIMWELKNAKPSNTYIAD
jgi:hypothetical protein